MKAIIDSIPTFWRTIISLGVIATTYFLLVYWWYAARAARKKSERLQSLLNEAVMTAERNVLDTARIARVAGQLKEMVIDLRERNLKLLGANEFLADKVTEREEHVSAIADLIEAACASCRLKKKGKYPCESCEVEAIRSVYLGEDEERKPVSRPPKKLCGSCDFCQHDAECNEHKPNADGTTPMPMYAPPEGDMKDVDCLNFSLEPAAVEEPEQPESDIEERSCANCAKVEACDKKNGSGYIPDSGGECTAWREVEKTPKEQAKHDVEECGICAKREECWEGIEEFGDSFTSGKLYEPVSFDNWKCAVFSPKCVVVVEEEST